LKIFNCNSGEKIVILVQKFGEKTEIMVQNRNFTKYLVKLFYEKFCEKLKFWSKIEILPNIWQKKIYQKFGENFLPNIWQKHFTKNLAKNFYQKFGEKYLPKFSKKILPKIWRKILTKHLAQNFNQTFGAKF